MTQNRKSGWKKLVVILVLLSLIVGGGFFAVKKWKPDLLEFGGNETNSTSPFFSFSKNETITNEITNVDNRGNTNIWDFLIWLIVGVLLFAFFLYVVYHLFKFLTGRNILSAKHRSKCEEKMLEHLKNQGNQISHEKAIQGERFYGSDDPNNVGWGFVFLKDGEQPGNSIKSYNKENLFSAFIDAKTFEVFGEGTGRNIDDLQNKLHLKRVGRDVPNFSGPTAKDPTIADYFGSNVKHKFEVGGDEE